MAISYSDSEKIEARVLSLLQSAPDVGANARIAPEAWGDWAVKYHLTPQRANLLRHLDFSGLEVLELGAGMGAISRFLAEEARELFVVEGTQPRFDALSERLRDLSNWNGVVANVAEVNLEKKFDVVCVIGVLEYSELYVTPPPNETPFSWFLKRAASFLKDDGVLILAIENQLGLKYLSGAAEDHTNRLFDGICGYAAAPTPRTFSRRVLQELLHQAGFAHLDEQFPFPDYKMTGAVLSSELLEIQPYLAAEIAVSRLWQNDASAQVRYFPEALALPEMTRAGLLPDVSNSFLILAAAHERSPIRAALFRRQIQQGEVAWHYSLERAVPCRTIFQHEHKASEHKTDTIFARKIALTAESSRRIADAEYSVIWESLESQPVQDGEKLHARLLRHAYFSEWTRFLDEFSRFLQWSFERWPCPDETSKMDGRALEAVIGNAVIEGEQYRLFDLEWRSEKTLPKSLFIYHNLIGLPVHGIAFFQGAPFKNFKELYEMLCKRVGVAPSFAADTKHEAHLIALMTAQHSAAFYQGAFRRLFYRPLALRRFARFPQIEAAFLNAPLSNVLAQSPVVRQGARAGRGLKRIARAALRRG